MRLLKKLSDISYNKNQIRLFRTPIQLYHYFNVYFTEVLGFPRGGNPRRAFDPFDPRVGQWARLLNSTHTGNVRDRGWGREVEIPVGLRMRLFHLSHILYPPPFCLA